MKTLAVDFDGVIHKHDGEFGDGVPKFEAMEGARSALWRLTEEGYKIIIFSTRLSPTWGESNQEELITAWLTKNGIEKGSHYQGMTGCKIPAIAYIDDRGIRFTNWNDIINYFI